MPKIYSSPVREIWRTNNIASCLGVTREKCENEEGGGSNAAAEKTHIDFVCRIGGFRCWELWLEFEAWSSFISAHCIQTETVASLGLHENKSELDPIHGRPSWAPWRPSFLVKMKHWRSYIFMEYTSNVSTVDLTYFDHYDVQVTTLLPVLWVIHNQLKMLRMGL